MPASPAFAHCSPCTPGNFHMTTKCVAGGPEMKGRMYFDGKKPGEEGVIDALEPLLSQNKWSWDAPGMVDEMTQTTSTVMNNLIVIGPDRVPLNTFIKNNRCAYSIQNWNVSGVCTTDPKVDDVVPPA